MLIFPTGYCRKVITVHLNTQQHMLMCILCVIEFKLVSPLLIGQKRDKSVAVFVPKVGGKLLFRFL